MRRLLAGAACALLLTGCGGKLSPQDALQDSTARLVAQANAGDVDGLRSAAASLRDLIRNQVSAGQLTDADADALRGLLSSIESDADLLTAPSPTPTPSVTPSATPSPTASPTPSPTPAGSPTPSPTPSEPEEESPTPSALPSITVGLGEPTPTSS